MAQLPSNRRKAALAASATAILASAMMLFSETHGGGGVNSWGQFVLGAIVGLALVAAIFFFLKGRSGPRSGDKP
jgi:hypothetical protein